MRPLYGRLLGAGGAWLIAALVLALATAGRGVAAPGTASPEAMVRPRDTPPAGGALRPLIAHDRADGSLGAPALLATIPAPSQRTFLPAISRSGALSATPTPTPTPTADPFPGETRLRNDNGQASGYSEEWRSGELAGAVLSARPSDYPLRVIGAQFMLHRFKGAAASANVSVVLYSLKPDGAPDRVVGQSSPFPVTTFYADWATVDLRSLQIVVDQPFMLALKYEEGLVGQTPFILTDSNREILPSRNWYSRDGGQTWEEHYDFWKEGSELGYNMIRAIVAPER